MAPDLLTVDDVTDLLQVGRNKVYDLIRTRRLTSVQIGRCRRIPAVCVQRYIQSLIKEVASDGQQETRQR